VNVACGRNLAFFITTLIEKCRAGVHPRTPRSNVHDEELMAYVSGDLQASTENSWIWQGSETGMALNQALGPASSLDLGPGRSNALGSNSSATALSEAEMGDWGGWERVDFLVQMLMREGSAKPQYSPVDATQNHNSDYWSGAGYPYQHNKYSSPPTSNHHQQPLPQPVNRPEPSRSRPSDRISIANII
jgi:hypothetical protein